MPSLEEFTVNGMGAGSFPVTGGTLARAFVTAWLTAIAAVVILPVIFAFGIAAGIAQRMVPQNKRQEIVIEGEYRVLN